MRTASELEYLRWIHKNNIKLGIDSSDVVEKANELFEKETGKKVPKEWRLFG